MSSDNAPTTLVARFLKSNDYSKTLEAFLEEAGLSDVDATTKPGDWTVEQLIIEKNQFDATLNYEKRPDDAQRSWTLPAPSVAHELDTEIDANVLCVAGGSDGENLLTVASASRVCKTFDTSNHDGLPSPVSQISGDSPLLDLQYVFGSLQLSTSMSGKLALCDIDRGTILDESRHHAKYVVQVASFFDRTSWLVATAAWDRKLIVYSPSQRVLDEKVSSGSNAQDRSIPGNIFGEPVSVQILPSNPESIIFVRNPDNGDVYIIASRRDSTFLYYYRIMRTTDAQGTVFVKVEQAGRQNLAPHSNAWVAFTPCSLAVCPTDPGLIAIATSHIPHMKVIIVRLLFPDTGAETSAPQTVAAVARADLAIQDREEAAISIHVTTMAPQTPYSTPQVVWRPDGSGLFVNGDDGVIRCIETRTGKVVRQLKAHEPGSKIRTLWAGRLRYKSEDAREVLVSGGFDRKVFVWLENADEGVD